MDWPVQIQFAYPRLIGKLMVWLGLPFLAVVILLLDVAAVYGPSSALANPKPLFAFEVAVTMVVAIWITASYFRWVRYRAAFSTSYLLTNAGVVVTRPNATESFVSWSDFEKAEDSRLGRDIRLISSKIDVPIVLFFGTPGQSNVPAARKFAIARELIRQKLGSRYTQNWW